jgi:hypothetical protein
VNEKCSSHFIIYNNSVIRMIMGSKSEITYNEAGESIKNSKASSNFELVLTLYSSLLKEVVLTISETMIAINETTDEIN